jgi:hypothetical protein
LTKGLDPLFCFTEPDPSLMDGLPKGLDLDLSGLDLGLQVRYFGFQGGDRGIHPLKGLLDRLHLPVQLGPPLLPLVRPVVQPTGLDLPVRDLTPGLLPLGLQDGPPLPEVLPSAFELPTAFLKLSPLGFQSLVLGLQSPLMRLSRLLPLPNYPYLLFEVLKLVLQLGLLMKGLPVELFGLLIFSLSRLPLALGFLKPSAGDLDDPALAVPEPLELFRLRPLPLVAYLKVQVLPVQGFDLLPESPKGFFQLLTLGLKGVGFPGQKTPPDGSDAGLEVQVPAGPLGLGAGLAPLGLDFLKDVIQPQEVLLGFLDFLLNFFLFLLVGRDAAHSLDKEPSLRGPHLPEVEDVTLGDDGVGVGHDVEVPTYR